jgi:hypothetical protein
MRWKLSLLKVQILWAVPIVPTTPDTLGAMKESKQLE